MIMKGNHGPNKGGEYQGSTLIDYKWEEEKKIKEKRKLEKRTIPCCKSISAPSE